MNKIKLIEGFHITQTEKKAVQKMLENGWDSCRNKPNTKNYKVLQEFQKNDHYYYKIRIGSFYTNTIGANPQWNYIACLIETNIKKIKPQLFIF